MGAEHPGFRLVAARADGVGTRPGEWDKREEHTYRTGDEEAAGERSPAASGGGHGRHLLGSVAGLTRRTESPGFAYPSHGGVAFVAQAA
jgi:hypothetical protein